jgi:predicted dehydrogenase
MAAAAERADRVLLTCFDKRHRGDFQHLKRAVDAGSLGDLYYLKAYWMRRNQMPHGGTWFTSQDLAGGGPLIDLGVHVLDLALVLLGEPRVATVSAATFNAVAKPAGQGVFDVEDLATAFIRFETGAALHLETSWAAHGGRGDDFGVTVYGTRGGAALDIRDYANTGTLTLYEEHEGQPRDVRPVTRAVAGHVEVVRQFHAAIRSNGWSGQRGQEGVTRAEIIDACYESAATGHEVVPGPPVD